MTAQTRIEPLAPELEKIIDRSAPIHALADGLGGAQGPAEGPLWWKEGGDLLFSDIHTSRSHLGAVGVGQHRRSLD